MMGLQRKPPYVLLDMMDTEGDGYGRRGVYGVVMVEEKVGWVLGVGKRAIKMTWAHPLLVVNSSPTSCMSFIS
jgi:hypothetical protein